MFFSRKPNQGFINFQLQASLLGIDSLPLIKNRLYHTPDPVNYGNANIFNGSQKVFVCYEIPERFVREIFRYTWNRTQGWLHCMWKTSRLRYCWCLGCPGWGGSRRSRQRWGERRWAKGFNSIKITPNSPVVPVEDALYILLFLAYPLTEVSVPWFKKKNSSIFLDSRPDLKAKLGLEHLYCFTLVHPCDIHVGPLKPGGALMVKSDQARDTFMSIRALSVMENLSDRFSPKVCFPLVKMFHATFNQ